MSLTPQHRQADAVSEATYEGFFNGFLIFAPSVAAVGLAVRHWPAFRVRTNWQSRTAIAAMPAFFVTALTGEQKLSHRMREIAAEQQHAVETVHWAELEWNKKQRQQQEREARAGAGSTSIIKSTDITEKHKALQDEPVVQLARESSYVAATAVSNPTSNMTETQHLAALYQQSVAQSGVSIVPGNELQWYHKLANFTQQNPVKVLAAAAAPAVVYIFYGRTDQTHLSLPSKLMHTRVFGQFATIALMLTIMGFKDCMDRNGRFMSQQQVDDRVADMERMRFDLMHKLELERQQGLALEQALMEAHEQDLIDRQHKPFDSMTKDAPQPTKGKKKKEQANTSDNTIPAIVDA